MKLVRRGLAMVFMLLLAMAKSNPAFPCTPARLSHRCSLVCGGRLMPVQLK